MSYFNVQQALLAQLMGGGQKGPGFGLPMMRGQLGAWRGGLPPQMMSGGLPFRMNQYQNAPQMVVPQNPQGATGLNVGSAQERQQYKRRQNHPLARPVV